MGENLTMIEGQTAEISTGCEKPGLEKVIAQILCAQF